ncbi:glycoside hydrolase family 5 protein [Gaoshiqia sediminis]|uniref:Glycoside hydrolase family 5 protein n=1 Tax=Gaoshiqia sediminis TaxID=2986998 RepID=A0AA42C8C0_9BACT|nr:glycoside hydrolase family 5 protein [Gaoshiqia sediminis]MCW0484534.1 glycoside hydrolase family 5 protein [Gaoshiqia sediminis]
MMIIKIKLLIFAVGLLMSMNVRAQLPTARELAKQMHVGWNLGNTLEAICGEDAWGGGRTSQTLIDSVKAAGFNTIRIPVAWFCHSDTITSEIDADWIARVKDVVDYCICDSLYVIINMHWDNGWLENRIDVANQPKVNERQYAYWTQIADYFKDYDEHLLFAGANEPNASDSVGMSILLSYYQTFVDAVRATGGNNSSRTLIIQGPETDMEKTCKLMNVMPKDKIDDRLMVEVHYYTPFQFCLMQKDADWGGVVYYWGKNNHSETEPDRNASWGEEGHIDSLFSEVRKKFVDKGIPVIIGEYGAFKRTLNSPSDQALNSASVEYFNKYVVKTAISNGLIPYYWDVPMGLFDRRTGKILDRGVLDAMMQGAKEIQEANTAYSFR